MSHTVVQCSLVPPTLEQLQLAFEGVEGFTRLDAARVAKRAFGVIADDLQEERANALAAALTDCGVPAQAIEADQLRVFEPVRRVPRADFGSPHLVIHDALGRATNVDWSRVRLIAAGDVPLVNTRKDSELYSTGGEVSSLGVEVKVTRRETVEPVLAFLIDGFDELYWVEGNRFAYNYLGQRMLPDRKRNFITVLRDVIARTPDALVNRGIASVVDGSERLLPYPTRIMFHREIAWLLWWSAQPH